MQYFNAKMDALQQHLEMVHPAHPLLIHTVFASSLAEIHPNVHFSACSSTKYGMTSKITSPRPFPFVLVLTL